MTDTTARAGSASLFEARAELPPANKANHHGPGAFSSTVETTAMCDECSFCYRAGWQAELRLTPENQLTCCDCWDAPDWDELQTPDDAAEMHLAMLDDKAHALRDRRAA